MRNQRSGPTMRFRTTKFCGDVHHPRSPGVYHPQSEQNLDATSVLGDGESAYNPRVQTISSPSSYVRIVNCDIQGSSKEASAICIWP